MAYGLVFGHVNWAIGISGLTDGQRETPHVAQPAESCLEGKIKPGVLLNLAFQFDNDDGRL